jgi:PAS domain S-box-containing protein
MPELRADPGGVDLQRICLAVLRAMDASAATVSLLPAAGRLIGTTASSSTIGVSAEAAGRICALVADAEAPVAIADSSTDPRTAGPTGPAAVLGDGHVGSALGVPMLTSAGTVLGVLCVFGSVPRTWTDRDRELLEDLARWAVFELELGHATTMTEADRVAWRLAVDAAGVGAFEWDLVTGELRWDDRLLEIFGLDERTFGGTIEAFNERVHPEDLARVGEALREAVETCGEYAAEYRIQLPDGEVRWVGARGRALADRPGGPAVQLLGAAYDTTAVQEGEARVARVLETMPTAFFQLDTEWRFTYVNAEAQRHLGRSQSELVGRVMWELFPDAVGSDVERRYRQAVESGEPVAFDASSPPPLDVWYEVRAWPSPDGLAVYFVDVTARHEAQEKLDRSARRGEVLSSVTEALASTLEATEGVSRLASLLVPRLADWCLVTLVDDANSVDWRNGLRDLGWAHADPEQEATLTQYAALRLAAMTDSSYLVRALNSRTPIVMDRAAVESVAGVLVPGPAQDLVRELAPESAFIVPLAGRDRTVGVLSAFRGPARGGFSPEEQSLLVDIGARAGLALDNARLYAEQRDVSEALQRSLLTDPPRPDGLEIAVRYLPAAEAAQVGGDWYDAFLQRGTDPTRSDTVVVIGDVIGHDVAAAAAMGQVRGLLRGIAVHSGSAPAEVVRGVDAAMETLNVETTATAVVARVESGDPGGAGGTTVRWANAGHPPPLLVTADGEVTVLTAAAGSDLLLGLDPAAVRHEHRATLPPGAVLVLYTDGLVERRTQHLDDGIAELAGHLTDLTRSGLPLEAMCDALLERMVPDHAEDDVALLAVRVRGQLV